MSKMFYMWCRWNVRKVWVFKSVSSDALQAEVQTNSGHKMLRTHPGAPRVFWRQNKRGGDARRKKGNPIWGRRMSELYVFQVSWKCMGAFGFMTLLRLCAWEKVTLHLSSFSRIAHTCVLAPIWKSGGREAGKEANDKNSSGFSLSSSGTAAYISVCPFLGCQSGIGL